MVLLLLSQKNLAFQSSDPKASTNLKHKFQKLQKQADSIISFILYHKYQILHLKKE